jgi:hypothetical protein
MPDQTIEKTPTAGVSVNQPESGTYGEGADLTRLRQELPPMNREGFGSSTGGPSPMPQPSPALPGRPGGRPTRLPGGVPGVLLNGPPTPPPAAQPNAPASNPQAARITLLEQLTNAPDVSETTREWARLVLDALRG